MSMIEIDNRKKYIDFLKIIALFYMFFQHAALTILDASYNIGIINFLYQLVPICAGLFLFSSGYSLSIIYIKNKYISKSNLLTHLIKRGVILILSGMLMFVIEFGFQFPDFIFTSNILNTIGYFLILAGLILLIPFKKIILMIIIILLILTTYFFERNKLLIFPINSGYEPLSPTIIFGFIGLLIGLVIEESDIKKQKIIMIILFLTGIFIFVFYNFKYGLFKIFYEDTGRYIITRLFNSKYELQNLFKANNNDIYFNASIWNYKNGCFIASCGIIFILTGAFYFLESILKKYIPRIFFLPAEYAFINYFYHLIIISLFILIFGFNIFNLIQFIFFLSVLIILSYALSFLIYYKKKHQL